MQKGYMTPLPTPKSHNVLIASQEDNQEQKYKIKKTKQDKNLYELTHKSKTQPHPIN